MFLGVIQFLEVSSKLTPTEDNKSENHLHFMTYIECCTKEMVYSTTYCNNIFFLPTFNSFISNVYSR